MDDNRLLVGTSARIGADRWIGLVTLDGDEGFWGVLAYLLLASGPDGPEVQAMAIRTWADVGPILPWMADVGGEVLYDRDPDDGHLRVQVCLAVKDGSERLYRRSFVLFPERSDERLERWYSGLGEAETPIWHGL